MWTGLLPIGSVVLLHEDTHRLMIIGHSAVKETDRSVVYDYSACEFPEGFQDAEHIYLFDQEQIEYVDCIGFLDARQEKWLVDVNETIRQLRNRKASAE